MYIVGHCGIMLPMQLWTQIHATIKLAECDSTEYDIMISHRNSLVTVYVF